jgi:glc operon protein GlcG
MRSHILTVLVAATALVLGAGAHAQQPAPAAPAAPPAPPSPYGAPITLDQAQQAVQAALAESKKNNWTMAIAVVEPTGDLVYFAKQPSTQYGSTSVAIGKAASAAKFRRPSKAFQDALASGNQAIMTLGVTPIEGGVPIIVDGKIIGAIGASGGTAQQDGVVAKAGADAVK